MLHGSVLFFYAAIDAHKDFCTTKSIFTLTFAHPTAFPIRFSSSLELRGEPHAGDQPGGGGGEGQGNDAVLQVAARHLSAEEGRAHQEQGIQHTPQQDR